jgi:hypothetical protein
MAKPSDADNRTFFDEHLLYEIQMFRFAYGRLLDGNHDQAPANALIECFLLHSRNLIEFFKTKDSCDFDPRDFADNFKLNKRFISDDELPRINAHLSHLSVGRTKTGVKKIGRAERKEIFKSIECELARFSGTLRSEFKASWGPTPKYSLREIGIDGPTPSATNVIDFSITGPLKT